MRIGKYLGARDPEAFAVGRRRRRQIGRCRTRIGLRHGDRNDFLAAQQRFQVALFLIRGSKLREDADRAEIAFLDHVRAARAKNGNLLDREHGVHQRAARPAILLGQQYAEQSRSCHLARHLVRELRRVRASECAVRELFARKRGNRIAKHDLFCGQREIHV